MNQEYPVLAFKSQDTFRSWLEMNHLNSDGIFLRIFKKNSTKKSITYAEAVEEALCYGWIDSIVKKFDEESYIQKFTPRRSKSVWSKINRNHIEKLTKEGRMQPSGLKEVENAKTDGRWQAAYDSPATMKVPKEFKELLEKHPKAKAFFETLNKTNTFAIAAQITFAKKQETKERRMKKLITMLEKKEKIY